MATSREPCATACLLLISAENQREHHGVTGRSGATNFYEKIWRAARSPPSSKGAGMSTKSPSATSGGNGGGRPPSVPRRRTSANGARPERAGQMKEKASLDAIYLV